MHISLIIIITIVSNKLYLTLQYYSCMMLLLNYQIITIIKTRAILNP